ncbi:hypothetical protein HF521_004442 [Silurus meridionalis]|uniref:Guanylate cyclase domain-containing protein n=1 Tax=Silurus meridionalis TaxID=175797 RepID=A0A8T0AWM6_SILME|nr:hypothetical protein HF521_004442 [Silurus meridionalis]
MEQVPSTEPYSGVLLFLDISGFTALTEKYTAMHEEGHGADELTNKLNQFISRLVICILENGGDILNFAGDAILAQWLVEGIQMSDVISLAVKCALKIQKECDLQEEKHDSELHVKIAISAGKLSKIIVGNKSRRFFVITGPAVDEVRMNESLANPGDIILSTETLKLCDQKNMVIRHTAYKKAVKMLRFKKEPRFSVGTYYQMLAKDQKIPEKGCLRSVFRLIPDTERKNYLRKYMMRTVLQEFDDDQPPELTSEIRPATIMFINVTYTSTYTPMELCSFVQEATVIIDNSLHPHGQLNKIFFFDKDCTFLSVFGLPGYKKKDESGLALKAAHSLHETCRKKMKHLQSISVGITTGLVYCGLVGHHLRNEYTVMGTKVNLAARLMVYYPGIVSCDWETRYYSGLPSCCFKEEIAKDLKGVSQPGKIYRFDPSHQRHDHDALPSLEMEKDSMVGDMHRTLTELNVLSAAEGLILRHAAFLGQTFTTKLLHNILPDPLQEKLNSILMTLFQLGIFKCASKPPKDSSAMTVEKPKLVCYCGSSSTDGLASVDGVWKCKMIGFCKGMVMEMTYQQLLKEQKRQLHGICASYLEKKPYRCNKCTKNPNCIVPKKSVDKAAGNGNDTENFLDKLDTIVNEKQARMSTGLRCKCAQLLEMVLIPIVRHWSGAEDISKTFYYLLECAAMCTNLSDNPRAMRYLKEAKRILENLKEGNSISDLEAHDSVQIAKFDQAVMFKLIGEILFNTGNILKAEENFKEAAKLLNCSLPSNDCAQSLKLFCEKIKKYSHQSKKLRIAEKKRLKMKKQKLLHDRICCLSFLWQIKYMQGHFKSASLAITMESNLSIWSTDVFEMLFTAMDYHQYSQFMNDKSKCKSLEAWLCRMCSGLSNCTENQRLINRLARTLAIVHLCRGNLKESADFTIRAQHLDGVGLDARTIGILHLALLFTGRYKEGMQLIYKLETISSEMLSIVAKGWFYAACLNILLYAGISLRPLEEFLDFVKESQSDVNLVADKSLMMHLYFSLALWFARLNDWENFTVFYDKAFGMYIQIPPTIYSISGVAVFLECNVLLFKQELVKFNRPCMKAYERTLQLFTDFRHCFGGDHIFVPRVLHLNAFLNQLVGKTTLVENLLMDALQLSEKQGNLLDNTQIKHSQATWSATYSQTPSDFCTDIKTLQFWDEKAIHNSEQLLAITTEHPYQEYITEHLYQEEQNHPEPGNTLD